MQSKKEKGKGNMTKDNQDNKYSKEIWEKTTVIKDMVHGYIKIPKPIVKEIIDSEQFQRLKDIEQTGMEALYPSATHKRFTHSLGVYHLAKKAFSEFHNNVKIFYPTIYEKVKIMKAESSSKVWERWQILFELAALLHDCGHSPFSHTLEFIYDLAVDKEEQKELNKKLTDGMNPSFIEDFGDGVGKPHERMSSLYIKTNQYSGFRSRIETLLKSYAKAYDLGDVYSDDEIMDDDIEFMIRMIIGCRYNYQKREEYYQQIGKYAQENKENWYIELQLRNCIIGMLNSQLDVDNLDYVVRDSKFSGYANHTVDLERLLSSFTIVLAVDVKNLEVTSSLQFDQCINLKSFRGRSIKGRLTGSCHVCNECENIKAHGKIILEDEEKVEANQRIYKTMDGFSAKLEYDGANLVDIGAPKGKEQDYAYIHFKGTMEGALTGTIFVNDYVNEKKIWKDKGDLRIYFAYEQKCMSVLMSAVYNSNFEKKWIYAHHISTFTNDFLYIYLLEKYAEYILKNKKKRLMRELDKWLINVQYQELKGSSILVTTREKMEEYKRGMDRQADDDEIYQTIRAVDNENLAVTNNVVREFIRFSNELGTHKEKYTESIYEILRVCCLKKEQQALTEESLNKANKIIQKYKGICGAEMQVFSDIMAMYDKPYFENGMAFYKASDRDLLVAYKNLYLFIVNNRGKYGEEYKEFEESYKELAERNYLHCMWKSQPEFEYYFSDWTKKEIDLLREMLKPAKAPKTCEYLVLSDYVSGLSKFGKEFWGYLKNEHCFERFVCVPQQIRTKKFVDYEMYMKRGNRVLRLKDVGLFSDERLEQNFFYFYYKQGEAKEFDVFEILDWLKDKIQKEIKEEEYDNQR